MDASNKYGPSLASLFPRLIEKRSDKGDERNRKTTESQTTLSKADLEELLRREAKPGSPVLGVFLDTDQSRVRRLATESLQE
jgi:hypothetical protein